MNELFFMRLLELVVDVQRRKDDEDVDEPREENRTVSVRCFAC